MRPAVVVVAFNRPAALQRLLKSAATLQGVPEVPLVISIDAGGDAFSQVLQVAEQFVWPFGRKEIIRQERPLGLMGHVFACGDLVDRFGAVILLEDDLFLSPMAYRYAAAALDYYQEEPRIAGISLNALWFHGITHRPFTPLLDDADIFFMQVAWFQGQAYSQKQWRDFRKWQEAAGPGAGSAGRMHELFQSFAPTEWFPLKTRYLVETDRYYLFPRESLTTNYGDAGTHQRGTTFFQVPLQTRRQAFRLQPFDQALAVYDSFQELLPDRLNRLTGQFDAYDYTVDLHGTRAKANIPTPFVLTSQTLCQPLATFGLALRPLLANVIYQEPGRGISFGRTADLDFRWHARLRAASRLQQYYDRRQPGLRQQIKWLLGRMLGN